MRQGAYFQIPFGFFKKVFKEIKVSGLQHTQYYTQYISIALNLAYNKNNCIKL